MLSRSKRNEGESRQSSFLGPSAHSVVTQAKAGVHDLLATWIPAFAGMTGGPERVDVKCAVGVNDEGLLKLIQTR